MAQSAADVVSLPLFFLVEYVPKEPPSADTIPPRLKSDISVPCLKLEQLVSEATHVTNLGSLTNFKTVKMFSVHLLLKPVM